MATFVGTRSFASPEAHQGTLESVTKTDVTQATMHRTTAQAYRQVLEPHAIHNCTLLECPLKFLYCLLFLRSAERILDLQQQQQVRY